VARALERFLRANLTGKGILVLSNLEMLFAYHIELNLLQTTAADEDRVLLLLPGRRSRGRIIMFHEMDEGDYTLPTNLIAENQTLPGPGSPIQVWCWKRHAFSMYRSLAPGPHAL
jgi:hypothetical protein